MTKIRKIRVLIIGPDDDLCSDIQSLLLMEGYQFFHSRSSEALDVAHEVFIPDMVIIFMMGEDDILSVFDYFSRYNIPILIMIDSRHAVRYKYLALKFASKFDILTLPVDTDDFMNAVDSMAKPIKAVIERL